MKAHVSHGDRLVVLAGRPWAAAKVRERLAEVGKGLGQGRGPQIHQATQFFKLRPKWAAEIRLCPDWL